MKRKAIFRVVTIVFVVMMIVSMFSFTMQFGL